MDPVIPANIGTALFVLLFLVLAWLVLRWIGPKLAAMRVRPVEDDSGGRGGYPWGQTWPENDDGDIDSGDGGGHPTAGQKIIAGLEDAVAHARGDSSRAKVTRFRAGDTANIWPAPSLGWRADPKEGD